MSDTTPRFAIPLLAAGQAQKEITHNEALTLIELLTQTIVESASLATPPASPDPGQAWIVPAGASGTWAGHVGALALWTEGGWRFVASIQGMRAVVRSTGIVMRRGASAWESGSAVATPAGGSIVDVQARAAIANVIVALQQGGLLPV